MSASVGLPEGLERAASALPGDADAIRPANGDPAALLRALDVEAAARVLGWLLVHEPEAGAELADCWADEPEVASGPLPLLRVDQLPKAGRKALSRVRHRLRSRGIEFAEAEPAAVVAKLPPVEPVLEVAFLSAVDPRGTRIVYLAESHPAGGVRLFELVIDEERGVVEFEVYTTSRGKARQFLRDLGSRERFPAVEAPAEAVRALIQKIAEGQPSARPLPRGFIEFRAHVAAPKPGARTPGELAQEALGAATDAKALAHAVELVRTHEVGPWPSAGPVLEKIAERIDELAKSPLVVSPAARRERAQTLLDEAQAEVFAGPAGAHAAQRFAESAYVLWKMGREAEARACLAAARRFREDSPTGNPVARALLEAVLAPMLASLDAPVPTPAESSLLVKP